MLLIEGLLAVPTEEFLTVSTSRDISSFLLAPVGEALRTDRVGWCFFVECILLLQFLVLLNGIFTVLRRFVSRQQTLRAELVMTIITSLFSMILIPEHQLATMRTLFLLVVVIVVSLLLQLVHQGWFRSQDE